MKLRNKLGFIIKNCLLKRNEETEYRKPKTGDWKLESDIVMFLFSKIGDFYML